MISKQNKMVELVPEHICPITGMPLSAFNADVHYPQQKIYKKKNREKIKIARIMKEKKQNDGK